MCMYTSHTHSYWYTYVRTEMSFLASSDFIHNYAKSLAVISWSHLSSLLKLGRRTSVNIIVITCTATALVSCHAEILEQDSKQVYLFWPVIVLSTTAH